jgi:hypothetical protein
MIRSAINLQKLELRDIHLEVASDEELTCHFECWYMCVG